MASDRRDKDAVNKVFGAEFPDKTASERDWDSDRTGQDHDRWLQENVPPHHH